MWNMPLVYVLVFMASVMLYAKTVNYGYVWDDRIVITENPNVRAGVDGIPALWVKEHSDYLHDKVGYRPLVLSSFALEQELMPMDPRPGHFINVLIYAFLAVVVVWFLRAVLAIENPIVLAVVALLFVCHPLHVEVVANIKSRDEMMQLLFGLLSAIAFHRWVRKEKLWSLLISILLFACALLSKENAAAMLGIFVLIILYEEKMWSKAFAKIWPIGLFALGTVVTVYLTMNGTSGQEQTEGLGIYYENMLLGNCFVQITDGWQLLGNANLLIYRYVAAFLWPTDLVYYSGFDQIPVLTWHDWQMQLAAVVTVVVFLALLWFRKKLPLVFFGIGFFVIALSPFLHLIFAIPDTMADRFAFAPSLGLCIASASLMANGIDGSDRLQLRWNWKMTILVGFIFFFAVKSWQRTDVWKDNLTLFSTDLKKLDKCAKAHEFYADALHQKLTETNDTRLIPEIIGQYERSIAISELSYYSFIKLGSNYAEWGDPQRGIEVLEQAVSVFPFQADPHFYLGDAYFRQGRFGDAIPQFNKAILYSPKVSDSYYLKARAFIELAELDSAEVAARNALQLFSNDAMFRDALSDVAFERGDFNEAIAQIDTIIFNSPTATTFWKKAIGLRQQVGLMAEADSVYRLALTKGVDLSK